jgi:hypothetical protein
MVDGPHGGIDAQTFGIIHVLMPGHAAVDRLAEEGFQIVLSVLTGTGLV